jgi:hypothetical protein
MVAPVASYIVHLSMNGTIESQGPVQQTLMIDSNLRDAVTQDAHHVDRVARVEEAETTIDGKEDNEQHQIAKDKKDAGKLVADEEKSEGRISRRALFVFFKALGGPVFWTIFVVFAIAGETIQVGTNYWLGIWARAYADAGDHPEDVSAKYYLGVYIAIVLLHIAVWNIMNTNFVFGSIRASRILHAKLVASIFSSTLRFLDSTPSGRIIARFTKDIKTLDGSVARLMTQVFELSYTLLLRFGLIIAFVPWMSPIALFIGILGGVLGELYIHGQLAIKREMSNAKR